MEEFKTRQEYLKKMSELRRLRDFHRKNYEAYARDMDELEYGAEEFKALVGKCVKDGNRYMIVDKYERSNRGCLLKGKGFVMIETGDVPCIRVINAICFRWDEEPSYKVITKEEYNAAIEECAKAIYNRIIELKD